jgi:hypothetical protein
MICAYGAHLQAPRAVSTPIFRPREAQLSTIRGEEIKVGSFLWFIAPIGADTIPTRGF